ncbi:fibronectin type III domain-containing protein [Bdellovibrio bacteriovorus]|nr:IPT/TIG domain-containing protein [Bdellovibrio bacteriovorus]
MRKILVITPMFIFLAGCLDTSSLSGTATTQNNFTGCISGTGLTNNSISLTFSFPSNLDQVVIYRDGIEVGRSKSSSTSSIIDAGLTEGVTYHYTCDGYVGAKKFVGSNSVDIAPVNTNAPSFAGITAAVPTTALTVQASWNPENSSAARASYYQIYGNIGSVVQWNSPPIKIVAANAGLFKTTISPLGDELTYSFGVRACTKDNICDGNTRSISLVVPDNGAPLTVGAESVSAGNFVASIIAPWKPTDGAIAQRQVFMCEGANCTFGTTPATITVVSDPTSPPTTLTLTDSINEYSTYSFKVVDLDPSGNSNHSSKVVRLTTGDLSSPLFNGITSASRGSPTDSKVLLNFIAIAREGTSDTNAIVGASKYLLYQTKALYPGTASNACNSLVPSDILAASAFAPGFATHTVTGLDARTNYSFCLRAQDAAGNISTNSLPTAVLTSDVTPPDFLGIQSVTYRTSSRTIQLGWNPSTAADLRKYILQLWKNTATPTAAQISTFNIDKSNSNGTSITLAQFPLNDHDLVYATVNACDNTQDLGIGAPDNCTTLTIPKTTVIPDINPPPGFSGIAVSTELSSPTQGKAIIKWQIPTWTGDYSGFRVYSVNPDLSINLLSSCPCATPGSCNNGDNSCQITALDPGRTYRFHVRAYDSVGNETDYLSPATSYSDLKIKDTTPPAFNSGLAFDGLTLKWSAASDNQYATGNSINYLVYRKSTSTFASATSPQSDGTLISTTLDTSYYENSLTSGGTYFYTVCAKDSQDNKNCDGVVRSFVATDVVPPTIIALNHTKTTTNLKKWNLTWDLYDAGTVNNLLRVRVYRKYGDAAVVATTSDSIIFDGYGSTLALSDLTGPINTNTYISYLLWVQDGAGNVSTTNVRLYSQNQIVITSTSGKNSLSTGGRLMVIKGTGFSNANSNGYTTNTVVKVGGVACDTTTYITSEYLTCLTPANGLGYKDVEVLNPDGSYARLTNEHQYVNTAPVADPCLSTAAQSASPFASGAGTVANPYLICTSTQLNQVTSNTYWVGGRSFKLGNNIDLNSSTWRNYSSGFVGVFDGDNYSILRNYIGDMSGNTIPGIFFKVAPTDTATFKNVRFLNWVMTTNTTYIYQINEALFSGPGSGGQLNLENFTFLGSFSVRAASVDFAPHRVALVRDMGSSATLNISNSDISATVDCCYNFSGDANPGGAILTSQPTNSTVNIQGSKIKINSLYRTDLGAGILGSMSSGSSLSVINSEVNYVNRYTGSTCNYASAIVRNYAGAANLIIKGVRASFSDLYSVGCSEAVGGFVGPTTQTYSGAQKVEISDSIITGSISQNVPRGIFGTVYQGTAGSGNSFTMKNIIANITYGVSAGTRYGTPAVSGFDTLSGTGLIYNNSTENNVSISTGGSFITNAVPATQSEMQNSAAGNIYLTNGFDFTSGTGKWKWCGALDYPRLMWEVCP